jgi:serine protease inhibitor
MHRRRFLQSLSALAAGAGLTACGRLAAAADTTGGPTMKVAAASNAAFAVDLFGRLRDKPGNLFYSPLSIEAALAMTSVGARGETLAEMTRVLHLTDGGAADEVGALLRGLQSGDGARYQLHVANALWGQQGLPFEAEFLARTRDRFGATLHPVDFAKTEEARRTINTWVEEQTRDKIKDLLGPDAVDGGTALVLTNAIYFKGDWTLKFDKALTREEPFHAPGGDVKAPLMHRAGTFRHFAGDGVRAVELPYAGDRVSMVVVLPEAADGLASLERSLTADRLAGWARRMTAAPGDVALPRFKTTAEFELKVPLEALGMKRAFGRGADFSGILATGPLWISKVIHKAFVDVNEEGSEAAAATAVIMDRGGPPRPAERFTFRADRPFLFVIRDTATGTPLFVGRLANPI